MANLPVESMKTGGLMWFPDLTIADPYFMLPILCSASMLLTIEVGYKLFLVAMLMECGKVND